jgi:hypothetical protein
MLTAGGREAVVIAGAAAVWQDVEEEKVEAAVLGQEPAEPGVVSSAVVVSAGAVVEQG